MLKGSIELVSSEIDHGSHFRATFQEVELNFSEKGPQDEPLVPQSVNIPRHFQLVPSEREALSLSEHFARSLTCFGFTPDDTADALVLDFVADPEQYRAALSRYPSNRLVFCLVPPFLEGEASLDQTLTNVIYVHGPCGTNTLISALTHADKIVSTSNADRMHSPETIHDLVLRAKMIDSTSDNRAGLDIALDNEDHVAVELATNPTDQKTLTPKTTSADRANVGPDEPKPSQPHLINNNNNNNPPIDHSQSDIERLPTSPADVRLAGSNLQNATTTSAKSSQACPAEHQCTDVVSILPGLVPTSRPAALLVDDNAINLRVLQKYCKKRGLQYVCAKDGLEAVSIFQERQERAAERRELPIDLIFMDLQMPECDGIEATQRIRRLEEERNWRKSVILMVTGQDSAADRQGADEAGSQSYHVKPISIKTLDHCLKRYFPGFRTE